MVPSLKDFLTGIHPISEDILDEYVAHWESFEAPRKAILTEAGKTEHYLYYVTKGIQRSYYLNEEKEHVIAFTYPPSFSGIPESFLPQKPSKYFLETITPSHFLRLPYEKHQELMSQHRPVETLFRIAVEQILVGILERHYELMAYSIEERFKAFARRSPHLLNMVPHKDLASYLRMDPTNFSKLLSSIKL